MVKYFKQDLTTKKGKIYFGIKVAVALLFTYYLINFFVQKYYYDWGLSYKTGEPKYEVSRIIIMVLVWLFI